ncbi:hypothetical protein [Merismopedia glauca]|uniref:hypothetical protein n=1 Tax=Merismopedia glauca TaxID=292586 RepID=UPI0030DDC89B
MVHVSGEITDLGYHTKFRAIDAGELIEPAQAGFVCVDAVSTADAYRLMRINAGYCRFRSIWCERINSTRAGGFRLCRRGFNRQCQQDTQHENQKGCRRSRADHRCD